MHSSPFRTTSQGRAGIVGNEDSSHRSKRTNQCNQSQTNLFGFGDTGKGFLVVQARRPVKTGEVDYGRDWYKQTRQNARRFKTVKEELGEISSTCLISLTIECGCLA